MLEFNEYKHIYKYRNIEIPSVSAILGPIDFASLPAQVVIRIKEAADRGSRVHKFIETFMVDNLEVKYSPDIECYINSFKEFLKDTESTYESIQCEAKVCSIDNPHIPEKLLGCPFAGTIDNICILNGKRSIIDYKTSTQVKKRHRLQIGAYMLLTGITKGYILHLTKNGYKLISVPLRYKQEFEKLLEEYYDF